MRFICLMFLLCPVYVYSQKIDFELNAYPHSVSYKYKKEFSSQREADAEIKKIIQAAFSQGYLGAYIEEKRITEGKCSVKINTGEIYQTGIIRKGNAEEKMLSSIGFREKIYNKKILSSDVISSLAEKVLRHYENNGYPFASFQLDSILINKNTLTAALKIEKNTFYKIDSLVIKGDAKIKKNYIENYISIKEGDSYNEKLIRSIDDRLKEISFLERIKATEVVFTKKQCLVYIYIQDKKASQFNGVVGFLPDNVTGKVVITGDVRIRLKNAIGGGELFDLNWRKLNNNIQDMRINFNYPFMFKSSFGFDGLFKLYKKDSTFLELHQNAALQYILKRGNFLHVSVNRFTSSLITPSMFENATVLPPFADVNSTLFGIGTRIEKLDYRYNPRSGYVIDADVKAGNKVIRKNTALNENLYDGINLKSVKYQGNLLIETYIPVLKRATIKLASDNGIIENENIFLNEMQRLGGIRRLRGFNEESIFASIYTLGIFEFRYLLEQNSNIYVFFDYCYYEQKQVSSFIHDTPYGFGAGVNFQTKIGVFGLNYALGSEQGNPVLLRAAKIHFGFVNYF